MFQLIFLKFKILITRYNLKKTNRNLLKIFVNKNSNHFVMAFLFLMILLIKIKKNTKTF